MTDEMIDNNPILKRIAVFHVNDPLNRIFYDEILDDLFNVTFGDGKHYKTIERGYKIMLNYKTFEVVDVKLRYLEPFERMIGHSFKSPDYDPDLALKEFDKDFRIEIYVKDF